MRARLNAKAEAKWRAECKGMADRIIEMRTALKEKIDGRQIAIVRGAVQRGRAAHVREEENDVGQLGNRAQPRDEVDGPNDGGKRALLDLGRVAQVDVLVAPCPTRSQRA